MEQKGRDARHGRRDVDPVLPFEFSPHASELRLRAHGRLDVIHDINMDVIEYNCLLGQVGPLPENTTKDNTRLRR